MSWTKHGPGEGRRGYHHGNLREALIRAALALIAEKGPSGFTFAEAARSAGVSPAAPYRHFRDRDELMADVARRGFERFEADLSAAWNGGLPDPFRAFAVLRAASEALAARLPKENRPPSLMMALHVWALSHGVASLFGRGDGGRRKLPMSPEELLEAGVLIYLQGLGLTSVVAGPKNR
jgi:AcrR family transcriptional regulator